MQKVEERIGQNSPVAGTGDGAVEQENIPVDIEDVNELMRLRRLKLVQLQEKGIEPYGERFERTHPAAGVVENYEAYEGQRVVVAGRLLGRRGHGKTTFADLQDGSGRIQIYVRLNDVGTDAYSLFWQAGHWRYYWCWG